MKHALKYSIWNAIAKSKTSVFLVLTLIMDNFFTITGNMNTFSNNKGTEADPSNVPISSVENPKPSEIV